MSGDRVGFRFGKNIDVEYVVNSPLWGKFKAISQV